MFLKYLQKKAQKSRVEVTAASSPTMLPKTLQSLKNPQHLQDWLSTHTVDFIVVDKSRWRIRRYGDVRKFCEPNSFALNTLLLYFPLYILFHFSSTRTIILIYNLLYLYNSY